MKAKLLFITLSITFLNTTYGQEILKTIGKSAKQKVEQQDFNTTRSNKEKGNLQDDKKSAPAPAPSSTDTTKPVVPSLLANAKYNSSYTFSERLTYALEDVKEAKTSTITYYYTEGAILMSSDSASAAIYDFTNESMITFNEKEKSAMAMSARWMTKMAAERVEKGSDYTVTKTGNTKQILGYTCEEYQAISESKGKYLYWVTTELKLNFSQAGVAFAKSMGSSVKTVMPAEGILMEWTSYTKKGEVKDHMIMTDYRKESMTKALSGYKLTAL